MKSFLYVVGNSVSGPVKLGFSNDPPKRLKQLQTGHAEKLELYYQHEVNDGRLYEGLLHKTFNHNRRIGEWFDLTVDEAIAYIQFILIEYGPSDLI